MENEKVKITVEEFVEVIDKVNMGNCKNFETLQEVIMDEFGDRSLRDELIDILETDFSFTCDADLEELSQDDFESIIDRINQE